MLSLSFAFLFFSFILFLIVFCFFNLFSRYSFFYVSPNYSVPSSYYLLFHSSLYLSLIAHLCSLSLFYFPVCALLSLISYLHILFLLSTNHIFLFANIPRVLLLLFSFSYYLPFFYSVHNNVCSAFIVFLFAITSIYQIVSHFFLFRFANWILLPSVFSSLSRINLIFSPLIPSSYPLSSSSYFWGFH